MSKTELLRKALREKIEQDFTIERMIIETMAVYEK